MNMRVPVKKLLYRLLPLAGIAAMLSCSTPPATLPPPAGDAAATPYVPQPPASGASAGAASPRTAAVSSAATLDAYKRDAAQRIHDANAADIFEGAPPALLKAVVVLAIAVDAGGGVKSVSVLRSNGYRDLDQRAVQSVRRASPLPRPTRAVLRGASAGYYETWLFRDDGRFQVRSVAMEQAKGGD
jgi:protein TonB